MSDLINFFAALLAGMLVGAERQWKARDFPDGTYVAGLRTFSIIGAFGGLSGILSVKLSPLFGVASFLSVSGFLIVSYYREPSSNDRGLTTEFGALGIFFSSLLCGIGELQMGITSAVTIFVFLTLKKQLHSLVKQLGEKDIIAMIKFLAMTAIIYPLIPDKNIFPGIHFNPAEIFKMVILISGLSMLGYIFVRIYGAKKGILASAFFGSLVSSTAVTVNMSKLYEEDNTKKSVCQKAVILACGVMFVRIFFIVFVLNPEMSVKLFLPLFISATVLTALSYFGIKNEYDSGQTDIIEIKNPANISSALKFGLLLGAVFFAGDFARDYYGNKGIFALSVLSGVSDVDAITITLSKLASTSEDIKIFVSGVFVAASVNTLIKGAISVYSGGTVFGMKILLFLSLSVITGFLPLLWIL